MAAMTGSIVLNGTKKILYPGENDLGQGLKAVLEYKKVTERAEHVLLKLQNTGTENSAQVTMARSLDMTFEASGAVHYHSLMGDDCGATSFMPVDFNLTEPYTEQPAGGRSSNTTGFPYFDLSWEDGAAVIGIGWTGQWIKEITKTAEGINVAVGVADCDFYLKPGEAVRFPSVLVVQGAKQGETLREFRRTMREHFSPKTRLGERFKLPIAIQCFDRYFQALDGSTVEGKWATEAGQKTTVDAAEKLRYIDTLWLDAAWFYRGFPHGVGNFRFSPGFPNGLKPVSDHAHEKGMKFVVWFEPERVYEGSDLYPQKEKLLLLEEDDPTRLFNLADPDARSWLEKTLKDMIAENGIDIYRQDFNMDPLEYWRRADEPGRRGITELKYIEGLYLLWDALLAAFPDLWIDNCASGGRRLDLETSMRSVTLWRSDTGCFPETEKNRVTVWNHNQILGLSQYLPYHDCAVWDIDAYTVRSTATQGMAANFHIFDPGFDFEQGARVLKEVNELRDVWDGDFYPLTEATTEEDVWSAYQLDAGDHGAVYAFRREKNEESKKNFSLCAVDRGKTYALTLVDENFHEEKRTVTGAALADGITLSIPKAKNSLIVKYRVME